MPWSDTADRDHGKMRTPRQRRLFESRREREFYRYYEPLRALTGSGPPLCDLNDPEAVLAHQPFSSPDRSLTAFCQLGALRLGTKRAMMFFFDQNYAYILAEATRTLSLQDDTVHDLEDHLWLGHSVIPRGYSVCEHTVNLPANLGTNQSDSNATVVHIINDLRKDTRFCDRPFVSDGPKARFYAGVPITTPKGVNIGAYCVLDDKPRDGLDEKSTTFLRDMAATIMTHLEMVRGRAEHMRDTRLVAGLGAFVKEMEENAGTGARRNSSPSDHIPYSLPAHLTPLKATTVATTDSASTNIAKFRSLENFSSETAFHELATNTIHGARTGRMSSKGSSMTTPIHTPRTQSSGVSASARASVCAEDLKEQMVASNVRATFQRAARLVREAVEVDAAIFLDATVVRHAGPSVDHHSSAEQSSDPVTSATDATSTEDDGYVRSKRQRREAEARPCTIMASSSAPAEAGVAHSELDSVRPDLTESFLRSLLRRYPRGKIWNFNEDGDASTDEESSEGSISRRNSEHPAMPSSNDPTHEVLSRSKNRKRIRINDANEIQRLFPGVRSIAVIGMWDQSRGRWFAACVVWSYSPLRLLSDAELKFLVAFNDVVLVEINRLEAQNSDRAKVDFISSISHELRSPLHGILGSVECLQEEPSNSYTTNLTSQIEICGRTLLDIVDHLLDYSKINFFSKAKQKRSGLYGTAGAQHEALSMGENSHSGDTQSLDVDTQLDKTTEEVVESTAYSFCCSRDSQTILNRKVTFILDIDPSLDWRCRIAIGGWKRICMNLVGNALKYTEHGYIKVSLSAVPIPKRRKKFNVIFTVSDTGCGMSKDFVGNYLFKAFSQEDSFVEGTGLGMSLVARIVKAFGGDIDVRSEKGVGTTVTVTMPVERSVPRENLKLEADQRLEHRELRGHTVGIYDTGREKEEQIGISEQSATLQKTCTNFGLETRQGGLSDLDGTDVLIITEPDARELCSTADSSEGKMPLGSRPVVVVCNSIVSARQMRGSGPVGLTGGHVELILQPAGPERVKNAVGTCLQHCLAPGQGSNSSASGKIKPPPKPDTGPKVTFGPLPNLYQLPVRAGSSQAQLEGPDRTPAVSPKTLQSEDADQCFFQPQPAVKPDPRPTLEQTGSLVQLEEAQMQTDGTKPSLKTRVSSEKKAGPGLPILLVDDNSINLQLLVTYAQKQNHRNTTARDGLQAVEAYKAACKGSVLPREKITLVDGAKERITLEQPRVVLMDISMPVLDGYEATRQIRRFEEQNGLNPATIVALTGLGSAQARQEAYDCGVDLFLTKPVRLKELTKILDQVPRE